MTFAPGEARNRVMVVVKGDKKWEWEETFTLQPFDATNASVLDGVGTGTILNDD